MSSPTRALLFTAVALGTLSHTLPAHADDGFGYLTAGLVFSIPLGGSTDQFGLGVEASYTAYSPSSEVPIGAGGFAQAQLLFGGGWRVDLGVQGVAVFTGAELGLAIVAPHWRSPQLGVHVAPFLSASYGAAAFRWTPMLTGPTAGTSGYELTLAPKLWWEVSNGRVRQLYDQGCHFGCVVGRPLLVDGRIVVAPTDRDPAWSGAPDALTDDALSPSQRSALAEHWTRSMREEHASVAAFARLSLQLMSLGAPPELLRRVHQAAVDEVDHARRCAALASRFAGEPRSPGALPAACAPIAVVDHATLAVDTLREGCVGEAVFAGAAARARDRATDPAVREALTVIARDEAEHAALAWDVVAWCIEAGGDRVSEALRVAAGELPTGERQHGVAIDGALLGRGWVSEDALASSWTHRRREALRKVGARRTRGVGQIRRAAWSPTVT